MAAETQRKLLEQYTPEQQEEPVDNAEIINACVKAQELTNQWVE